MTDQKTCNISIIIPTLNEKTTLGRLLTSLQNYQGLEIIVVDGGSTDQTVEIAKYYGARAVSSSKGRGSQQNHGARMASNDTLLFLHSDTFLPLDFQTHIQNLLDYPDTAAGAFRLKIDASEKSYRVIEWGTFQRSRLFKLIYGDQGIFVRKDMFFKAGGFPDQVFLEDVELIRRLKKLGRIRLAQAAVTTSSRRWRKRGFLRTTVKNQLILAGYFLGMDHDTLGRYYYR